MQKELFKKNLKFLKYIQNTKTDFSKLAVLPRLAILLRPPLQYILSDAQVGGFCIFQQNNILLLFFMIFELFILPIPQPLLFFVYLRVFKFQTVPLIIFPFGTWPYHGHVLPIFIHFDFITLIGWRIIRNLCVYRWIM